MGCHCCCRRYFLASLQAQAQPVSSASSAHLQQQVECTLKVGECPVCPPGCVPVHECRPTAHLLARLPHAHLGPWARPFSNAQHQLRAGVTESPLPFPCPPRLPACSHAVPAADLAANPAADPGAARCL